MKLCLLLILSVLFVGCAGRMPNNEIIKQTKLCHEAGLAAQPLSGLDGEVVDVQCVPSYEDKNK